MMGAAFHAVAHLMKKESPLSGAFWIDPGLRSAGYASSGLRWLRFIRATLATLAEIILRSLP